MVLYNLIKNGDPSKRQTANILATNPSKPITIPTSHNTSLRVRNVINFQPAIGRLNGTINWNCTCEFIEFIESHSISFKISKLFEIAVLIIAF